jgi:hypothetical protein
MAIKAYTDPQDAIKDAQLVCCPHCWQADKQTVRVGQPFVTPEGLTLRPLSHQCGHCHEIIDTYYAGRQDGTLYSGTWHDWELAGQTVGILAELRYVRRSRGR